VGVSRRNKNLTRKVETKGEKFVYRDVSGVGGYSREKPINKKKKKKNLTLNRIFSYGTEEKHRRARRQNHLKISGRRQASRGPRLLKRNERTRAEGKFQHEPGITGGDEYVKGDYSPRSGRSDQALGK